jgi:hypothetical protein
MGHMTTCSALVVALSWPAAGQRENGGAGARKRSNDQRGWARTRVFGRLLLATAYCGASMLRRVLDLLLQKHAKGKTTEQ